VDVIYIPGNHDGELRKRGLAGKNVLGARLEHEFEFTDPKGRKIFVCHGDRFDPMQKGESKLQKLPKALKYPVGAGYILLVDKGYDAASRISSAIDRVSEHVLHRSVGLFSKVRTTLEGLSGSKGNMEQSAISHAQKNNYDGIICGHFHMSAKRDSGGKLYLNSGDWVESYTALAMDKDGEWKVVKWTKERQEKGLKRSFKQAANDNPDKAFRPMTEKCLEAIKSIWPGKKPKGLKKGSKG